MFLSFPAHHLAPTSKGLPDLFHTAVSQSKVTLRQAQDRRHAEHYSTRDHLQMSSRPLYMAASWCAGHCALGLLYLCRL